MTEQVFQATAAGAVAAVSTFSLNDFSDPYQFTHQAARRPRRRARPGSARISTTTC